MTELDTEVLIVGGGPVGLSTAVCLARHGIKSILVEKYPSTTNHPKARGVTCRTMELFNQWGISYGLLKRQMPKEAHRFIWLESLQGDELTRVSEKPIDPNISPTSPSLVSQDWVERELAICAMLMPNIDCRFSTKFLGFEQEDETVIARIESVNSGEQSAVRAQYLIGADGAYSSIRKSLNIGMQGQDNLGEFCNIYCEMDLTKWVEDRPAVGYCFTREDIIGTVMLAKDGLLKWIVSVRYDVLPNVTPETFTDSYCIEYIKRVIADSSIDVSIINKAFWNMAALVAERYHHKRVFLAGDAAHRLPPTGGLGMNTGIQDAHNLAWKLAFVIKGYAEPSLLDTYYEERAPIALRNIQWSASNAKRFEDIYTAIYRHDTEQAKAALIDQSNHLNKIGLDLGFRYESGVLAQEETEPPELQYNTYVPSTHPGCRAPHYKLIQNGKQISTLDLFDDTFVLLSCESNDGWHKAASMINTPPVKHYRIGPAGELQDPNNDWARQYHISPEGAVLVRPDGHIAWRSYGNVSDPSKTLQQVMSQLFTSK